MISISNFQNLNSQGEILAGQIVESTYNDDSLIVLDITKSLTGEEASRTEYTYENLLLVKEETSHEGVFVMKRVFEYDLLGNVKSEKLFDDSKKMIYEIVKANNRIIEKEYDHYSKSTVKITKHLDEIGDVIKEVDDEGNETIFDYKNGNLVNVKMYESKELVVNEDYFYDDNRNEIKSVGESLDIDEKVVVLKTYNDANKLIREEQFTNDVLTFAKDMEYNSDQQLIRSKSTDKITNESELITIEYRKE